MGKQVYTMREAVYIYQVHNKNRMEISQGKDYLYEERKNTDINVGIPNDHFCFSDRMP